VNIDLFKGESHTADFLELNSHGLPPVMVDGDAALYNSSAIASDLPMVGAWPRV
jgi:glutathione S-transferase